MKTHLHKPIKILQSLSRGKTKKFSTKIRNILAFSKINDPQAKSRIQQEIFLHVIPIRIIVP